MLLRFARVLLGLADLRFKVPAASRSAVLFQFCAARLHRTPLVLCAPAACVGSSALAPKHAAPCSLALAPCGANGGSGRAVGGVGVAVDKGFDDFGDLLLLSARQLEWDGVTP